MYIFIILYVFISILFTSCFSEQAETTSAESSSNGKSIEVPTSSKNQQQLANNTQNSLSVSTIPHMSITGKTTRSFKIRISNSSSQSVSSLNLVGIFDGLSIDLKNTSCGETNFTLEANSECVFSFLYKASKPTNLTRVSQTLIYQDNNSINSVSIPISISIYTNLYSLPESTTPVKSNQADSTSINTLFVDKLENIYIGTNNGISISTNKGQTFTNYSISEDSSSNNVNAIAVYNGFIYVATNNGLFVSSNNSTNFTNISNQNGINNNNLTNIAVDPQGSIIASTQNGELFISKDEGKSFTSSPLSSSKINTSISTIHIDKSGTIYIGTDNGIYVSNSNGGYNNYSSANGLASNNINNITTDNNVVYISTSNEVSCSNSNTNNTMGAGLTFGQCLKNLPGNNISSIAIDSTNNKYFAASAEGLLVSTDSGTNFTNYNTSNGLLDNNILSLFLTQNGGAYFLSKTTGVSYFESSNSTFKHNIYSPNEQNTSSLNVNKIFIDSKNIIYAATKSSGLMISKDSGNTFTKVNSNHGLTIDSANDVVVDNKSIIYVAGPNGIFVSSDNAKSFISTLSGMNINSLFVGNNTGRIYAATPTGLLFSANNGANFTTVPGLENNDIKHVFVDNKENIYASTQNGLLEIISGSSTSIKFASTSNGLCDNNVNASFINNKGYIFVATQTCLSVSKDGGVSFINLPINSPVDFIGINAVNIDNKGNIYVATQSNGIAVSNNGGSSFTNYTISEGLTSNTVNSIFIDAVGSLYAATTNGISALDQ